MTKSGVIGDVGAAPQTPFADSGYCRSRHCGVNYGWLLFLAFPPAVSIGTSTRYGGASLPNKAIGAAVDLATN